MTTPSPKALEAIAECRELLRKPDVEAELAEHYAGVGEAEPSDPATTTRARDEAGGEGEGAA